MPLVVIAVVGRAVISTPGSRSRTRCGARSVGHLRRLGGGHRSAGRPGGGLPVSRAARPPAARWGLGRALAAVVATLRGALGALGLLRELKPRLVVGVGGYASVAASWRPGSADPHAAARAKRRARAANRLLARIARCICVGFDDSAAFFPEGRVVHTGTRWRAGVLSPTGRRSDGQLGLLIFGGSAGARRINQATLEALRLLGASARRLAITHQTGVADVDETRAGYAALGWPSGRALHRRHGRGLRGSRLWLVARAGAMTCAELTAVGLPAISSPTRTPPTTTSGGMRRSLVRAGAAEMILDREPQRRTPRGGAADADRRSGTTCGHGRTGASPRPARRGRPGGRGVCSPSRKLASATPRKPSTRETWQSRTTEPGGWIGARNARIRTKWPRPLEQPPMLL